MRMKSKSDFYSQFLKRVIDRRKELRVKQEALALYLGYKSRSSISKIESGVNDIPVSKIELLANALRTTPEYLMGFTESKNQQKGE